MQIITCTIISIAYGANNARTSVGMFTLMYHIHSTGTVTGTAPISTALRGVGAVGMSLGTLLCGYRLAPVTGMSHLGLCATVSSWTLCSGCVSPPMLSILVLVHTCSFVMMAHDWRTSAMCVCSCCTLGQTSSHSAHASLSCPETDRLCRL